MVWLVLGLTACGQDSFKPPPIANDSELYWDLVLNHRAVMLSTTAPYNTLQLVATPRNYQGEPIAGLPTPRFISTDPAKVAVTADGMLLAGGVSSQLIPVIATLTTANLKHSDTVFVKVVATDPLPELASFSVHPVPPDSAKVGTTIFSLEGKVTDVVTDTLRARAANLGGVLFDEIPAVGSIPVYFRSSDSTIARINRTTGIVLGLRPGSVTIYASTTVFGVRKEDVLPYRIGFPIAVGVEVGNLNTNNMGVFKHSEFWVGTGANVAWVTTYFGPGILAGTGTTTFIPEVDITFTATDLSNIVAPNVASFHPFNPLREYCTGSFAGGVLPRPPELADCRNGGSFVLGGSVYTVGGPPPYPLAFAVRRFTAPGTYEYRSTIHGTSGRIIVVDEQ